MRVLAARHPVIRDQLKHTVGVHTDLCVSVCVHVCVCVYVCMCVCMCRPGNEAKKAVLI